MINLKEVIEKYPESLTSTVRFRAYINDLYPEERARANIIVTIFDCGIAEEIKRGANDQLTLTAYALRLENNYGYSQKLALECLHLWKDAYGKDAPEVTSTRQDEVRAEFEIDEDGVLTKYNGNGGDIRIPDGVCGIGKYSFWNCSNITSVIIPDSVPWIGEYAFWGCGSLTNIRIPDCVTEIGEYAFGGCKRLINISIPRGLTRINIDTFCGCVGLPSIDIPKTITEIDDCAFFHCWNLTNITIPDSVIKIGEGAFSDCKKLKHITIPNSVQKIGEWAFHGCDKLSILASSSSYAEMYAKEHKIPFSFTDFEIEDCVLKKYKGNDSCVRIPDGVTKIGGWAFSGRGSLTNVSLPNSVTMIGKGAFSDCRSLTSINIPNDVTEIEGLAFKCCCCLESIEISDSVTKIGSNAFGGCGEHFAIHAPAGSYAEQYARENKIYFQSI